MKRFGLVGLEISGNFFMLCMYYDQNLGFYSQFNNSRDWCVSRQLWWGHRIPAYRCNFENNSTWFAARSEEEALLLAKKIYGNTVQVEQDIDVLDTWFSSALLPFTSIGWPSQVII